MSTLSHRLAEPLKRTLPQQVWQPMRAIGTAVVTPFRFSFSTGHFRSSLNSKACKADGAPLPWYTYPAIDFLTQRSFKTKTVLEFGGGQSTLWWAARAKSVLTIEEDADWAAYIRARATPNVTVHFVPAERETRDITAVEAILGANAVEKYDIIIIDGHLRFELVPLAFARLAPGGMVIMDNAEGYQFIDQLKDRDCQRVDFFGFSPGGSLRGCTSMAWVRDCFLLKPDIAIPVIEAAS